MAEDNAPTELDAQLAPIEPDGRLHLLLTDRDGNDVGAFDLEALLAGKLPGFDHRPWALAHHAETLVALRRMTRAAEDRLRAVWDSKDWGHEIDHQSETDQQQIYRAHQVLAGE